MASFWPSRLCSEGLLCRFSNLLFGDGVSALVKLQLYDLYFEALRAGHGGQALDLAGLDRWMPAVVESGDSRSLMNCCRRCCALRPLR